MSKTIFKLGLLSFFVATVVFGTENHSLIETLSRAFVVFIGVVVSLAGILAAGYFLAGQTPPRPKEDLRNPAKSAQQAA